MKLVLIEWLDAHSRSQPGWKLLDDLKSEEPVPVKSVGWLLSNGKRAKTLVPHISGDGEKVAHFGMGELTIPATRIVRMKVLRG